MGLFQARVFSKNPLSIVQRRLIFTRGQMVFGEFQNRIHVSLPQPLTLRVNPYPIYVGQVRTLIQINGRFKGCGSFGEIARPVGLIQFGPKGVHIEFIV